MAAGNALAHRGREVAFEVGELSAGNMPGVIATQAVGRVVEGEAAIEQHQAGLLQALGQLLRAEQLGDGHTELLWWCWGLGLLDLQLADAVVVQAAEVEVITDRLG